MRVFPLQTVLDLAERRAESGARLVRLAYVAWLNARTWQVRLEQRRADFVRQLGGVMRAGCTASVAQQSADYLQGWRAESHSASEAERLAKEEWQKALEAMQLEKKRVEAFRALADRHAAAQKLLQTRRENILHDELSQRAWRADDFSESNADEDSAWTT